MAIEQRPPTKSTAQAGKPSTILASLLAPAAITSKERMFFTERLALLLETGNSIHPSLEALREQSDDPRIIAIIDTLIADVVGGAAFSAALAKHPAMFSATYVSLVRASEQGGFMAEVLQQLQAMEEKQDRLHATLVSAFAYPAFLSVFSGGVVVFILLVVFPKFGTLFQSIYDQLPITTRLLMGLSDWARRFWPLLLIGPGVGLYLLRRWLASAGGQEVIDRWKITLPGLSDILIQVYLVNFCRVMSLSLSNGVSVMEALSACHDVVRNRVFVRFVEQLERTVGEGKGLAAGFQEADFIPAMVRQTVRTADQTGNLALVMGKIADFYEREIERRITLLSKMAEPVMLLVMGLVIGVIVSSLILPIFKLSRAVH